MRPLVESLKRLYGAQRIAEKKIVELYKEQTITEEEMKYILNHK